MNFAYVISAHKNPNQIIRLITTLNPTKNYFFIHVNKKNDDVYNKLKHYFHNSNNIFFVKRCLSTWGSFGQVEAVIEAINKIIDSKIYFDYVITLSGQDYPIKSEETLISFLTKNRELSYMQNYSLPNAGLANGGLDRIKYYYSDISRDEQTKKRKMKILKEERPFPKNYIPYNGSQWWCLTKECIFYIYNYIKDEKNKTFVDFYKNTLLSVEMFFQTLLMNSPLKTKVINSLITYTHWTKGFATVLLNEDYMTLKNSKPFFARKFDINIDKDILYLIDKNLLHI